MERVRVKICGITSPQQAALAAALGVDAIGLVFYPASPRAVGLEQAREIARAAGPFTTVVGLFVNAEPDTIEQVLAKVPLGLLQFHGDENPAQCERYHRPYIKALRMKPGLDVASEAERHANAAGLLLDAYHPALPGGTGEVFDWDRFPVDSHTPLILAGGLTPDNVADAIAATHCYGVDVSGGVESAPGVKDAEKMRAFVVNATRGASQ